MKKLMTMIAAVATAFGLYAADTLNNSVDFSSYTDVNPWTLTGSGGQTKDTLWTWTGTAADPATDEAKIEDGALVLSTGSNVLSRKFAAVATDIDDGLFVDMVLDYNGEALDAIPTVESGKIAIFALDQSEIEGIPEELKAQTNVYVLANYGEDGKALYRIKTFDFDTPRRVALKAYENVITGDADARAGFLVYMGAETAQLDKLTPAVATAVYAFDANDQVVWTDVKGEEPNYLGRSDVMSSKWVKGKNLFISLDADPQTSAKLTSVDFVGRAKLASITLTDDSTDWPADDVRMAVELTDAEITDITGAELMGEELVAEDNGVTVTFKAAAQGKDNVTVAYTGTISGPDQDGVYTITFNENNTLTVTGWNAAATVNGTAYPTIAEAINAANEAAATAPVSFVLNSAQSGEGENISFSGVEMITLDLNGQTLTVTEEESGYLANTGKLTILDSDTEKKGNIVGKVGNYGTLVINSGTFNGKVINDFDGETSYGNLMIAGGVFNDKVSNGDDCTAVATAGDFAKFDESEETGMTEAEVKALLPTSGEKTYEVVPETIESVEYWKVQEKAIVKGTVIFICDKPAINETVSDVAVGTTIASIAPAEFGFAFGSWTNGEGVAVTEVAEGTIQLSPNSVDINLTKSGDDYQVTSSNDLAILKAYVDAKFDCAGKSFKQTANIDMTGLVWAGIGPNGKSSIDYCKSNDDVFRGTYDGGNFTIQNVTFAKENHYSGFFNWIHNATIKNLTIDVAGFEDNLGGYGMVFGMAKGCTIQNVTVTGEASGDHNMGGFGIKAVATSFTDCTNRCDIAAAGDKVGGFLGFESSLAEHGTLSFTRCLNEGDVNGVYEYAKDGGRNGGAGGFIGQCSSVAVTFTDCVNTGTITWSYPQGGTIHETDKGGCGTIIGSKGGSNIVTVNGTCMAAADKLAVGNYYGTKGAEGLNFATVDGNVATFVALDTNKTLKVMAKGATATYAFEAPGVLTFVTNMCEAVFAVTAAGTLALDEAPSADGVTFTATLKPTDPIPPLPDNPTADDVNNAVDKANFADTTVKAMIGGDPAKYAAFKTWADTVTGGQVAVVASTKAAVSYQASAIAEAHLYTNDPEVKIETITLGNSLVATVKVTDGNTVIKAIEAIKDHVKASTDLANWTGASATATINTDTGIATITVEKPGTDKGFIKVLVD